MPAFTGARLVAAVLSVLTVAAAGVSAEAASVSLTWNAPSTNADGSQLSDLAGYRIYLGTSVPSCPGGSFHSVSSPTTTPGAGQTVSTRVTALSAGTTYFARVTAVDTSGNESGCSSSASGVAQADLDVTPATSTSFGSVAVGGTVDRTFTVQNTGSASISGAASVGAPFSIVSGASFSLAAGASQSITVRFRPTSAGSFAGNVTFTAGGDTVSRGVSGSTTGSATAILSVTRNGTGTGTVSSSPAGITCGADCTETVAAGAVLTLTASPASGSVFAGWSGACSGTATCPVTVSGATTVTATFNASPTTPPPPSGALTMPGSPSVTLLTADASGVTLAITWSAAGGAASYSYVAAFGDGSAAQQGTVTTPSLQLRMPYHASGAATSGFICIRSVSATGQQSADQSCGPLPVPARSAGSSTAPAPAVSSLSPASATAGSAALTLTVNGSGFVAASGVRWNGAARTTTFVSASQLRAAITAADLATARSVSVTVVTPAPGGGTSGAATFSVTAAAGSPVPAVSSLSPASAAAGSGALTLTVNGSGFVAASGVRWNGAARTTTFVSSTQLRAAITAADLTTARSVSVTVVTPAPGGGTSGAATFSVTPPPPPPAPGAPSVTRTATSSTTVTFTIAWGAVSGATSYRWAAAFNDGSAPRQGTVTTRSFQLQMPYHASGAAAGAAVCIWSVNASGQQSTTQACSAVPVPARPVAAPPPSTPPPPPPPPPDWGWGTG